MGFKSFSGGRIRGQKYLIDCFIAVRTNGICPFYNPGPRRYSFSIRLPSGAGGTKIHSRMLGSSDPSSEMALCWVFGCRCFLFRRDATRVRCGPTMLAHFPSLRVLHSIKNTEKNRRGSSKTIATVPVLTSGIKAAFSVHVCNEFILVANLLCFPARTLEPEASERSL